MPSYPRPAAQANPQAQAQGQTHGVLAIAKRDGRVPTANWRRPGHWLALVLLGLGLASAAGSALAAADGAALALLRPPVGLGSAVPAANNPAGTLWLCHLSGQDTQLVCIAEPPAPGEDGEATPGADPAPLATRATTVHGTRFPLDPARVYSVDLLAPATDAEWLEQLAQATVCYRSPGCMVVLTGLGDLLKPARGRFVRSN